MFELSIMAFSGCLCANSLVAATIAPSMMPSSSANPNSWVTIPPSWACLRMSLLVLRAETHDLYLPSSAPISITSLECRHYGLVDRLVVVNNVEAIPAPRALVVAGTALYAQVTYTLGFPIFVGDCTDRAGCRTAAASHTQALIDDISHKIAEACGCSSLGCHHERFKVCSCKILLLFCSFEEQVCHHADVPDHLGRRCASGDVHVNFDHVADRQECLMLWLVLPATPGKPSNVAITGTTANCDNHSRLFTGFLNFLNCEFVINTDRTLNKCNIHLRDVTHIGKRQTIYKICIPVQNCQEPSIIL